MDTSCVKNAIKKFQFSILVAVSHYILPICKWTYTSAQPLQGGGKIFCLFSQFSLTLHLLDSDPHSKCESGSRYRKPIECGWNQDPDPDLKHSL
jgi:hypothetical protein